MTNTSAAKIENFYVVGGTLRGDAPSYVARQADVRLYESLKENEVCYVLTARQMGKSSLMVRTAARLRAENVSVAVLDLTGLGQNLTAEQWYNGLLERVAQQFDLDDELDDFWRRNQVLGPLQRWVSAVREVVLSSRSDRRVVIFVDEIDAVRSLAFSTDEFFAGIRELYNRRAHDRDLQRLTFCLMGVASPSDLIRDTRTTPFNIGRRIELTDFTEIEAAPLAQGLGREQAAGSVLLRRVLYWTGGHPYLTQRLCQAVAENRDALDTATVDRICQDLFLSHRARERDDNLLFVRERILHSEADTASLLALYDKVRKGKKVRDEETSPLIAILRLSGITRLQDGYLKVRNRVYATVFDHSWVISNTPGAELRRQRAAYKKGVKVAALTLAPLILVGIYTVFALYRRSVSVPVVSKPPQPPAFWASFSISSAADLNNGSLLVKTGDANVAVFLNNQQYGNTTREGVLLIERLPADSYSIRVEKPGFQSISQQAKVEAQKITPLTFKLQPQVQAVAETASFVVQGAPDGAQVKVDGVNVGVILPGPSGGYVFSARPGEHTVSVSKDGFLAQETRRRFTQGDLTVLDMPLKPDTEARRWQALANSSSLADLEEFLKDYPEGRFSGQARNQAEQIEWNMLKDSSDLIALSTFASKYPTGQHAREVQALVKSLQDEQEYWIGVRNSKDLQKLQAYRQKYPQGHYFKLAEAEISRLQEEASREEIVRTLVQRYADAYQARDAEALRQIWPTLDDKRYDGLREAFRMATAIRMQVSITKVDWGADHSAATVTASANQNYIPKGGRTQTSVNRIVFQVGKINGTWSIKDVHSE